MSTTRVELSKGLFVDVVMIDLLDFDYPVRSGFCRVGKTYCKFSSPGKVCKPVEGTITTECAVEGCKRFC